MMKPVLKSRILEVVRNQQISTRAPVSEHDIEKLGIPVDDLGRELRRLYASGDLYRTKDGRYFIPSLEKINNLGRWSAWPVGGSVTVGNTS